MNTPLTQRLVSMSMATFLTLAMLGSVSELFLGDAAPQAAQMAQKTQPSSPAPRG